MWGALYKESIGESRRDWMLFFFKQSKKLAEWCLPRYEEMYGKVPTGEPKENADA